MFKCVDLCKVVRPTRKATWGSYDDEGMASISKLVMQDLAEILITLPYKDFASAITSFVRKVSTAA